MFKINYNLTAISLYDKRLIKLNFGLYSCLIYACFAVCISIFLQTFLYPGCEYGDRIQGCEPWHCGHTINTPDILSNCCGTCNTGDVIPPSNWNVHTTSEAIPKDADTHTDTSADACTDRLKCKTMIAEYGKFRCYTPEIFNSCCETCSGLVDNFNKGMKSFKISRQLK